MKKVKCVEAGCFDDLTVGKRYTVLNSSKYCIEVKDDSDIKAWYFRSNFEGIKDIIVESVLDKYQKRRDVGLEKYGVGMDRDDLSTLEWLEHAQEEAMDFTLYLEAIMNKLKTK